MSDENTTDVPEAKDAQSVAAAPATHEPVHFEHHSNTHIHVRWHIDALIEGHQILHGFIKDISHNGGEIFLDHNLRNINQIKLRIHVPPLDTTSSHHVIGLSAKIIYTIYDPSEFLFRSGIKFTKFELESEQTYLLSRIDDH